MIAVGRREERGVLLSSLFEPSFQKTQAVHIGETKFRMDEKP